MKKFSTILLAGLLFSLTPLCAQDYNSAVGDVGAGNSSGDDVNQHSVGVGIGETFLVGDFANQGENSITMDLYYGYSASHSFDVVVNGHYSKHKNADQRKVVLQGLNFGIKAKFYQFDAFSPYGLAGLGFYRPYATRPVTQNGQTTMVESEKKTAFGINLGVGADLRLNRHVEVGVLAHYHNPFDVKQNTGDDTVGSYFKLLLLVSYVI